MTQALPTLAAPNSNDLLAPPFLTAQWRYLAMLNYEIEPHVLRDFVPPGTELSCWQGRTFVSLVGFCFHDARINGLSIPFHRNFEEINLRFYVVRPHAEGERRGVVFVREIVPRLMVAGVARLVYNENFSRMPMRHRIEHDPLAVEYALRAGRRWYNLSVHASDDAACPPLPGSLEEFIVEHYWAYSRRRDGGCNEYRVEHPPWRIWPAEHAVFDADLEALYGRRFAAALCEKPAGAFIADGSAVAVRRGDRLC
jgi:uncharacterized protein YqjF (DUF2071 family)